VIEMRLDGALKHKKAAPENQGRYQTRKSTFLID